MQTANILLCLAGDTGNQVPKRGVTAAEIAVLNAIHGDGACVDIEPAGDVQRSHREERARLLHIYGKIQDGKDVSPVGVLFPGAAARVFETLAELDLPPEQFKAKTRVTADDAPVAQTPSAASVEPDKPLTAAQKRAAAKLQRDAEKAAPTADVNPTGTTVVEEDGEDDGIGEMPDKGAFG